MKKYWKITSSKKIVASSYQERMDVENELSSRFPDTTFCVDDSDIDIDLITEVLKEYQNILDQYTDGAFISFVTTDTNLRKEVTLSVKPGISKDVPFAYNDLEVQIGSKKLNLYYNVRMDLNDPDSGLNKLENLLKSADLLTCPYYDEDKANEWQNALKQIEDMDIESACKELSDLGGCPIGGERGYSDYKIKFMKNYVNFYEGSSNWILFKNQVTIDDYCNNVIDMAYQSKNKREFSDKLQSYTDRLVHQYLGKK